LAWRFVFSKASRICEVSAPGNATPLRTTPRFSVFLS